MLPDHAGGGFENVTKGSRLLTRFLLDPRAVIGRGAGGQETGLLVDPAERRHGFFAWKVLPETKGKSLEGIEKTFISH
jgi:hypothetical protein